METVVSKLGQGGRVVLPAQFRKALGVKTGDDLILSLRDGEVRIFTRRQAIRRAQGMLRRYIPEGRILSEELIAERRAEAARE